MAHDSDATHSIWTNQPAPSYPALASDVRTGICVIGAGIAGLTTAYLLTRAGHAVTVVDDGPVGGGETSRTTAHLTVALDDRYHALSSRFGDDDTRKIAESHAAAIEQIETIASTEDIDCDFERVDGYLILADPANREELDQELEATHRAGILETAIVPRVPVRTFESGPALCFPRQAQLHPLKYLQGLANAIVRDGGIIACGTKVVGVEDGEPTKVTTAEGHTIFADSVVVATNSPVNDWMVMHTKLAPYRTYVVGLAVPVDAISPLLLWDTANPYHYARIHPGEPGSAHDILLVGGEDHKTGQSDDTNARFGRLERWARDRFPNATEVVARWSGQVFEPVDGIAYLGRNPGNEQHIYIITGTSGNGFTYGTIGAMLVSDLIQGIDNPWTALYDPSRITFKSVADYARENLNVAEQYAAWLTPGDVGSVDEIPNGSGAVIRRGMHKVAVYKDENGAVTERSAVCTHLYCIVDWNDTEKTWDCPCHGSRFDCHGKVVTGPAIADLERVPSEPAKAEP